MTAAAPRISVIVPVYNVADHVGACIASLRAQSLADFEALVIDDGSTDGSGTRAMAAIGGDPRFRVIRQENRGLSGARNTGLDAARGDFIAFLDSDDQFAPEFLARMHDALVADGGDWVACAIALCFPGGQLVDHSAIHGAPMVQPGPARRILLDDCTEITRHFPSAWNKLYRRSLINDLRFPEGTWFEDHEFFWALAARTGHLLYLPEPLYRHARARPGQITGSEDDRVFEQFAVLERLAVLMRDSGALQPEEGLARLASRLVHERAGVLRSPGRRARFLAEAADFFARHDIAFSPFWDADISAALGLAMAGTLPLSVTLHPDGADSAALAASLRALDAQTMPDFELLSDDPALLAKGHLANGAPVRPLPCGRDQPQGRYLVTLRAGDQPVADCFRVWVNGMERLGAALGISGFERGSWQAGHYDNALTDSGAFAPDNAMIPPSGGTLALTPLRILRLHPEPAARIVRRDLAVPVSASPLAAQTDLLQQASAAGGCVWFPFPAVAIPPRPWASPLAVALAIRAARGTPPYAGLPRGWEGVVMARAVQAALEAAPGRFARLRLFAGAALAVRIARLRRAADLPADRLTAPRLCWLLGLSPPGDDAG